MRADIQLGIEQGEFDVTLDHFLLEQVGALLIAALHRQLCDGADTELTNRACDNLLRMLGLTPRQSSREVARASRYLQNVAD